MDCPQCHMKKIGPRMAPFGGFICGKEHFQCKQCNDQCKGLCTVCSDGTDFVLMGPTLEPPTINIERSTSSMPGTFNQPPGFYPVPNATSLNPPQGRNTDDETQSIVSAGQLSMGGSELSRQNSSSETPEMLNRSFTISDTSSMYAESTIKTIFVGNYNQEASEVSYNMHEHGDKEGSQTCNRRPEYNDETIDMQKIRFMESTGRLNNAKQEPGNSGLVNHLDTLSLRAPTTRTTLDNNEGPITSRSANLGANYLGSCEPLAGRHFQGSISDPGVGAQVPLQHSDVPSKFLHPEYNVMQAARVAKPSMGTAQQPEPWIFTDSKNQSALTNALKHSPGRYSRTTVLSYDFPKSLLADVETQSRISQEELSLQGSDLSRTSSRGQTPLTLNRSFNESEASSMDMKSIFFGHYKPEPSEMSYNMHDHAGKDGGLQFINRQDYNKKAVNMQNFRFMESTGKREPENASFEGANTARSLNLGASCLRSSEMARDFPFHFNSGPGAGAQMPLQRSDVPSKFLNPDYLVMHTAGVAKPAMGTIPFAGSLEKNVNSSLDHRMQKVMGTVQEDSRAHAEVNAKLLYEHSANYVKTSIPEATPALPPSPFHVAAAKECACGPSVETPVDMFMRKKPTTIAKPTQACYLNIPRSPITCPATACNRLIFVSDFNKHLVIEHQNTLIEQVSPRQYKNFLMNPRISCVGANTCNMVCLIRDKVTDLGSSKFKDFLPMLVMSTRLRMSDLYGKGVGDDNPDSIMIWMTGIVPEGTSLYANMTVWREAEGDRPIFNVAHSGEIYSIRDSQEPLDVYKGGQMLLLSDRDIKILTNNGKDLLRMQLFIH